ncbi:iron-sulfur cluster assembly protein [Lactobacillus kefiranofaciens]|uniref:Iron-sulfur cluster assembly protein n=1 Tax=Lactobacillus kefiranofaciens TaxID=267818 RepID=A0AAX3UBM8_9LACO|nr:iron-sulfur cluster assembly protein [Lactobacillus kefiranofaciens]AEG41486.1 Metal-sulfur cluster biosynthetic protein [Lactobacillus kefiranofaciens subsp. kefiranofaciens]KRL28814.1 metal-sulfur cluster biosynthetic protein [Lactobacillus kefiranofaciens subsp. kefirgranum DSM 10550 = JCM 8572]KRM20716.1 metal-sulfur cluster biosynthetic protein [Lactobacillus kefiranofaciens subsp. kefiranofaciens DSM 5016 = JCM 6985]MCJ2172965.1 iron-sulfur cluster assembly protein [Lactobacillus kefir
MKEENIKQVDQIMTALTQVIDPELQVDVVNLGLIYGIDIEGHQATVKMTLTISGCPLSDYLQKNIEKAVLSVDGIDQCQVQLVWYPVWSPERMSHAAKKQLEMLDNAGEKAEIEQTEEKQKIIDFSVPIKKLADEYPDFVQIMYDCGFTRIKIPGLLKTVGRVMTIPLGAQAMKIDLDKIKKAFEAKGYKVIE